MIGDKLGQKLNDFKTIIYLKNKLANLLVFIETSSTFPGKQVLLMQNTFIGHQKANQIEMCNIGY